uniref:Senescence regulator n=1 Tax=Kalanchoe fedtschenkoi TaxID=63787 RepID=A0A7N0U2L4_KALFE
MAYEYQESDIIFSDHAGQDRYISVWPPHARKNSLRSNNMKKLRGNNGNSNNTAPVIDPSMPICIPGRDHFQWGMMEADEGWEGGAEVVPPHLIVARRVAGKAEFSVCSGKGRTLKGRDLKEVRNEILRMTGFLEA